MHSCAPFLHLCATPSRYTRYTPSPNDPCATHMHPYVTHPCALPMHPRAHFLHPCVMHPCAFFMHPCATHHLCSLYIHPLTQSIPHNTASASTPRHTARVLYPVCSASIFRGAFKLPSAQSKTTSPKSKPPQPVWVELI